TLRISNVGDLAIGGIETLGSFLDRGIMAQHGDFGAVETGGTLLSMGILPDGSNVVPDSLDVPFGNLRVIEASSIGVGFDSPPGNRGTATGTYGPPGSTTTTTITGTTTGTTTGGTGAVTTRTTNIETGVGMEIQCPNGTVGLLNAYGSS